MNSRRVSLLWALCGVVAVLALASGVDAASSSDAASPSTSRAAADAAPLDCSRLPGCAECTEMTQAEWKEARKAWLAMKTGASASATGLPATADPDAPKSGVRKLLAWRTKGAESNSTARLHGRKSVKGGAAGATVKTDVFRPSTRPPLKCTKCAGQEYALKDHRCGARGIGCLRGLDFG
jgi:hypothetical protein